MNIQVSLASDGKMKDDNVVRAKSYALAVRVVRLYQHLLNRKHERVYPGNFSGPVPALAPT